MTEVISTSATQSNQVQQIASSDPPALKPMVPNNGALKRQKLSLNLLISLVVLAMLLGFALLIVNQIKPTYKANILPANELLATVGNQKIYVSTVEAAAKEQYLPSAITHDVLKKIEDLLIERVILRQVAAQLSIQVTDQQVLQELSKNMHNVTATKSIIGATRDSLLKQAIMTKQIKNVQAHTISINVAPDDYPSKPEYVMQRAQAKLALSDARTALQDNASPYDIAGTLYTKYGILQHHIGINARIFVPTASRSSYPAYAILPLEVPAGAENAYDPNLLLAARQIKSGEVMQTWNTDNSGGFAIKAISVTGTGYRSYAEFLVAEKKKLVKGYKSI